MVVTRKTPVAPVPTGSRTNSSQPLPRAAKAKTTSSLADSESPARDTQAVAAAKNAAASQKPPAKSKHKNRHHKKAPKPSRSFLDGLVYLSLFLLGFYAFTTCPQDQTLSNPVCRSLSQYRNHVLEPYILPPLQRALSHPSVAPYVEKAERLERKAIRPVVVKTARFTAPYAAKAKRVVWNGGVVPAYNKYVVPQWRARVLPPWHKYVSPKIAVATPYVVNSQRVLEDTAFVLHTTYTKRVKPVAIRSYVIVKPYAIKGYRTVRPHALNLYAHLKAFGALLAAKAGEARREYVDPHVVRIWDKVLELSGAGPVGSPTEQHTPVPEPVTTAATTEDSTTESISTETSVKAVVTPVESSSSSTPSATAEEEISSTTPSSTPSSVEASSSSSVVPPPVETAPPVAEPVAETTAPVAETVVAKAAAAESTIVTAVEEELSAASVVIETAHGMESSVVEDIIEDIKSSTEEAKAATEDAVVDSTPTLSAVSPIDTAASAEAEDDDEDDFYAFLGLVEEEPVEKEEDFLELTPQEAAELERIEAEEQREAKIRRTAEKRKDLEGRMARSSESLTALAKEKNKQLRKALVGMRKDAVAKMDNPESAIGGQLPGLEREADKLLKGLEGYLKKETKVNKGGDPVERMSRWEKVVAKVEEKLSEKIQQTQGAIQQFHVDLKAEEVNEGMAIIQQVKDTCGQAQGDVGLDLSWLDDVTYMDWQVYHDLARIGENFQAEASEIQAGTHAHPPVDPFMPRLDQMNKDLNTLVNEVIGRINGLKKQAVTVFTAPPVKAVPPPAAEPEEPKPEVSILPIEPADPPKDGISDADPAQVVIGKSPEQVAQALENAEKVAAHEEL
ncbi:hypothetical protein C8R43DRAFT_964468 [Mycena crocata]|nr:hypothetical protein C8R43DRAFT_964468 [Mycena crocata]